MFGSQGRETGVVYTQGKEDFEVYFPEMTGIIR